MKKFLLTIICLTSIAFAQVKLNSGKKHKRYDKTTFIMRWTSAALSIGAFTAFTVLPPTVVHRYNYDTNIYGPDKLKWYEDTTRMPFLLLGTTAFCFHVSIPLIRK
jgi:hypothetical protein